MIFESLIKINKILKNQAFSCYLKFTYVVSLLVINANRMNFMFSALSMNKVLLHERQTS